MHYLIMALAFLTLTVSPAADEIKIEKDIPFLGPDRAEKMDAYLPSAEFARPLPAVLWIHGGSWVKGDKADAREQNVGKNLAENGYAVFSINYKLGRGAKGSTPPTVPSPSGAAPGSAASGSAPLEGGADVATEGAPVGPPWPQNFADCKSALRFIRKEAARFGIDPARIAVAGGSAGGHLSLLVGVTGDAAEMNKLGLYPEVDSQVVCIIDFYGVAEITAPQWARPFAGASKAATAANLKAAAPLTYLKKDTPPILIVHGDADKVVPLEMSTRLSEALEKLGVAHQMIVVPGAPHAFHLQPQQMDLRPAVLEFLGKYLGKPQKT